MEKLKEEYDAMMICREKVVQRGLPMQIVDAEYQWDRRKLTFYFKADKRVDFRELTKENFRIFKVSLGDCHSDASPASGCPWCPRMTRADEANRAQSVEFKTFPLPLSLFSSFVQHTSLATDARRKMSFKKLTETLLRRRSSALNGRKTSRR